MTQHLFLVEKPMRAEQLAVLYCVRVNCPEVDGFYFPHSPSLPPKLALWLPCRDPSSSCYILSVNAILMIFYYNNNTSLYLKIIQVRAKLITFH